MLQSTTDLLYIAQSTFATTFRFIKQSSKVKTMEARVSGTVIYLFQGTQIQSTRRIQQPTSTFCILHNSNSEIMYM